MENLGRQKNFFLVAGFIILGVKKNEHFFDWFQSKSEELSFNSKDNSLTFLCDEKRRERFFKICHFLITGRVVLHNKFYKKNFIYQLSKMENFIYLGKKTSFWWLDLLFSGWKKMNIFSIDFNRKSEELSFNSKR